MQYAIICNIIFLKTFSVRVKISARMQPLFDQCCNRCMHLSITMHHDFALPNEVLHKVWGNDIQRIGMNIETL